MADNNHMTVVAPIATFWDTEITCGKLLGKGSYCSVMSVQNISLCTRESSTPPPPLLTTIQATTIPATKCTNENDNISTPTPTVNEHPQPSTSSSSEKREPDEFLVQASRMRLEGKFLLAAAATATTKRDPYLAIHGKPLTKEMDDPEMEPAPKLALKRVRTIMSSSSTKCQRGYTSTSSLTQGDIQIAKEDLQRELELLLELSTSCAPQYPGQELSSASSSLLKRQGFGQGHPNIIELCGVGYDYVLDRVDDSGKKSDKGEKDDNDRDKVVQSQSPTLPLQPSFLLLTQLRTTLTQRLKRWRDESTSLSIYRAFSLDGSHSRQQWIERLLVISKVAHALNHLHAHCIIFRDTKPDNVGYDYMDIPKLFDFGLAKKVELKQILLQQQQCKRRRQQQQKKKQNFVSEDDAGSTEHSGDDMDDGDDMNDDYDDDDDEGLFHLTPNTGTLRYMAVEVGKERPYGWTADTYSLAILMHEVLSLKVPFGGIRPRQFPQLVWNQGLRLPIDPSWPSAIQELLPRMWDSNPTKRPRMNEIVGILDGMLRGSDQDLFPKSLIPWKGYGGLISNKGKSNNNNNDNSNNTKTSSGLKRFFIV